MRFLISTMMYALLVSLKSMIEDELKDLEKKGCKK